MVSNNETCFLTYWSLKWVNSLGILQIKKFKNYAKYPMEAEWKS